MQVEMLMRSIGIIEQLSPDNQITLELRIA